jgi:hypothetical protein
MFARANPPTIEATIAAVTRYTVLWDVREFIDVPPGYPYVAGCTGWPIRINPYWSGKRDE